MNVRSFRSFAAPLLALSLLLVASAHSAERPAAPSLSDGVVVDVNNGVAYVFNAQFRIEALDLSTGTALWTSEQQAKPLALSDGLLIAQAESTKAGSLNVVAFNALDGNPADLDAKISLPEGIKASLTDRPSRSFRVAAKPTGADTVAVAWYAKSATAGVHQGYLPSPYEGQAPSTGSTKAAAPAQKPAAGQLASGGVTLNLRTGEMAAEKRAVAFSELDPTEPPAPADRGLRYVSKDGRHVLVSQRQPNGGIWQAYRWVVSEAASGQVIGELTQHAPTAPFVVDNSALVWVSQPYHRVTRGEGISEPMQLQSVDLQSGQTLWKREVAKAEYVGPVAP